MGAEDLTKIARLETADHPHEPHETWGAERTRLLRALQTTRVQAASCLGDEDGLRCVSDLALESAEADLRAIAEAAGVPYSLPDDYDDPSQHRLRERIIAVLKATGAE